VIPTTSELLLAYDAQRPRSQQVEIGMSQLGGCRRQTGYMLSRTPPDEGFANNGVQAVMGTAIHEAAAQGAKLLVPDAEAESLEVHFGGLTGHPDLYLDGVVRDVKTLGYTMQLEDRRRHGPKQRERWQIHTYGAGLIVAGHPVHTVELDFLARDSGDEFLHSEPFDPIAVADAMAWLHEVRTTEPAMLARDYRPDSAICRSCPFFERCWEAPRGTDDRHVLYLEDPDAGRWALQLWEAGLDLKQAQQRAQDARGALDHLRSVSRPGEKEYIGGLGLDDDDVLEIRVQRGRSSLDGDLIRADYERAGAEPPMRTGEPVIRMALVKRGQDE
jgi:hypothetical protein